MKRRAGFTLVELLVVIAIIALLFGILLPVLSNVELIRKKTHCEKNLTDIHRVLTAYCAQFDGRFPYPVDTYYGGSMKGDHVPADLWAGVPHVRELKKAGADAEIFFCPFSPYYGDDSNWQWRSWEMPYKYKTSTGYIAVVYVNYSLFFYRTYPYNTARFRDGRYPPIDMGADDDIPIVADTLFTRSSGTIRWGWYHQGGVPEGLFDADCYTLMKGGRIVFTDRNSFDWNKPAIIVSTVDFWWCALGPE